MFHLTSGVLVVLYDIRDTTPEWTDPAILLNVDSEDKPFVFLGDLVFCEDNIDIDEIESIHPRFPLRGSFCVVRRNKDEERAVALLHPCDGG